MKFSVNTRCLFKTKPMDDAFAIMKQLGYLVYEHWRIAPDEIDSIRFLMEKHHISLSAFCTGFFTLNDESLHDEYETALKQAIETARLLTCSSLITQVGQDTGAPRKAQHDAIVKGLVRMKPYLEEAGITLLVEPLNDVKDHKGYYLTNSQEGFDIIRKVNSPNIRLLYDVYHQLHMGEDVMDLISHNLDLIGHMHIAGFPARDHQLFEGHDYRPLLKYLYDTNVQIPVGLELMPPDLEHSEALLNALSSYF